jgi:CheY-like chemotaxis protein
VLEDNVIIAMNAADALRALGAEEVVVAGSNGEALRLLDAHPVRVAVLDVDLGGQTSAATAIALKERGIPFLLATGYDPEEAAREAGLSPSQVLTKPYSTDGIAAALAQVLGGA